MKKSVMMLAVILLAACGESAKTKEWYVQNDDARAKRVQECRNDAGIEYTPDCQNALAAQSQVTVFGK